MAVTPKSAGPSRNWLEDHAVALKGAQGMRKSVLVVAVAGAAAVLSGTVAWAQAAPPTVPTLAVQRVQQFDPARLVVDGTIGCQVGKDFSVSTRITELGAKDAVKNSTTAAGPCTVSGPQAWSVTVQGSGGTFIPVITTYGTITDPATRQSTTNVDQRGVVIVRA